MIITNDAEYADRCRSIRVHGMGRERYYYDYLGYTGRLDEMQCAVLRVKMKKLADWTAKRVSNARYYDDHLAGLAGIVTPIVSPGNNHTYHQYTVKSARRDELQKHLSESGVPAMIYYPVPIHHHTPYIKFAPSWELPVTEEVSHQVLSLPIQPHLLPEHLEAVVAAVKSFA
jgi:dTDP-4-amino-4,6-dideoxygalactose transaminase